MSPLFQPVQTNHERTLDIHEFIVSNPASTYFVKIEGNEFDEFGIHNEDILVIDRSRTFHTHEWYVVIIENEFTLLPLTQHPSKDCEYWGAVTFIIHKS
jgi:DNA polymerase V